MPKVIFFYSNNDGTSQRVATLIRFVAMEYSDRLALGGSMNLKSLLFSFKGRIGRLQYWVITLILMGIGAGNDQSLSQYGPENPMTAGPALISFAVFIILVWVGLAVQVKRWHDRDKTGWWALINLVPVLGQIWVLIQKRIIDDVLWP